MIKQDLLPFDIETVPAHKDWKIFQLLEPSKANSFKKKILKVKKITHEPTDDEMQELYSTNAGLYPEYGKIVCISFGFKKEGIIQNHCYRIENDNEFVLVEKIFKLFEKLKLTRIITGWNIKHFDLPYIIRKLLIHGFNIPENLNFVDKKPWEIKVLDLKELWKMGSNLDVSFEDACQALSIDDPKIDIDGSQVYETYYFVENGIDKICTYCDRDLTAMWDFIELLKDRF